MNQISVFTLANQLSERAILRLKPTQMVKISSIYLEEGETGDSPQNCTHQTDPGQAINILRIRTFPEPHINSTLIN